MARMPNVQWRPLPTNAGKMSAFDIICIHTMVWDLESCDAYFRKGSGVNAHFGTSDTGVIRQWVDTATRSGANYNGNHHIISIENADRGPGFPAWNVNDGSAVPAFTAAQIEANAQIIAWACRTHNIPCQLIPDAKPGRRGIGYHRQGVPGYMVAGAEQWSSARGKVCPGNRRIAQIPQIIARANAILAGFNNATPNPEDIEVAIGNEILTALKGYGRRVEIIQEQLIPNLQKTLVGYGNRIENTEARTVALEAAVRAMAPGVNLTEEQLEAAVSKALKDNVVRVNVDVAGSAS